MKRNLFLTFLFCLSMVFIGKAGEVAPAENVAPVMENSVLEPTDRYYKGNLGTYYINRKIGSEVTISVPTPAGFRGVAGPYASPSWVTGSDYVHITYSTQMLLMDDFNPSVSQIAVTDGYYLITLVYTD